MKISEQRLALVDIETTGGSYYDSKVLEVAVICIENSKVVKTFQTLLDPGQPVSHFITNLTGITTDDVAGSPTFAEIADELYSLLEGCIFVAHNVRFDYSFIKQEFKRLGVNFKAKTLCTVRMSRVLYPQFRRHNLSSLIERFEFNVSARHRAYDDADVLRQFLEMATADHGEDAVSSAASALLKKQALPAHLTDIQIDNVPNGPGVYIFEDETGSPLYVGKSIHIRDRVLSHFNQDHAIYKELRMSQTVKNIRTIPTAGELSALILESKLVKDLQPLHNRRLRRVRQFVVAKRHTNADGYHAVALDHTETISPDDTDNIIGVFKSMRAAKDALHLATAENLLCPKVMGLEKGKGPCFSSHLGKCKGACTAKELPLAYNLRFDAAFYRSKISSWPFEGPIVVTEKSRLGVTELVFDKWCLLKEITHASSGTEEVEHNIVFDMDMYKLLTQYLKKPKVNLRPYHLQSISH